MIINTQKLKCFFGRHKYTVPDMVNPGTKICCHCRQFGYVKYNTGAETWREYNEKGDVIYYRTSAGTEIRFDDNGRCLKYKPPGGRFWNEN